MVRELNDLLHKTVSLEERIKKQYNEGLCAMGFEIGWVFGEFEIISFERFFGEWGFCRAIEEFGSEVISLLGIGYILVFDESGMCDILELVAILKPIIYEIKDN